MPKLSLTHAVAFAVLSCASLCNATEVTDQLTRAATTAQAYNQAIGAASDVCQSQMLKYGDYAKQFPFVKYFAQASETGVAAEWILSRSSPVSSDPMPLRSPGWVESFRTSFDRSNTAEREKMCAKLVADSSTGQLKFRTDHPLQADLLDGLPKRDNDIRISQRNAGITTGCMKKLINLKMLDFESARTKCECITKAATENASSQELDDWLAAAGTPAFARVVDQPWYKRSVPFLSACFGPNHSPE